MQRIGRGGRSSGRPTVIVIGANEEEMPDLFQDPKAFFGESASKELCVASTKLMMKHSDRQLLGNRVQLEEISEGQRERNKKLLEEMRGECPASKKNELFSMLSIHAPLERTSWSTVDFNTKPPPKL